MLFTPSPGDAIIAFSCQPGRCYQMVLSDQLQATHCTQSVSWRGRWADTRGSWHRVEACEQHADGVEGRVATRPR
ncbi:MAG TPA: hypothetical protein VG298_12920 [Acidimicrobiales bacterium]|nr:hypothetical protein [Acidimicrobiales bacterium]